MSPRQPRFRSRPATRRRVGAAAVVAIGAAAAVAIVLVSLDARPPRSSRRACAERRARSTARQPLRGLAGLRGLSCRPARRVERVPPPPRDGAGRRAQRARRLRRRQVSLLRARDALLAQRRRVPGDDREPAGPARDLHRGVHAGVRAAAAIPGGVPRRAAAGTALRLGHAPARAGRRALVPPLPRHRCRPGGSAVLDAAAAELESHVRRLPHHRLQQALLRCGHAGKVDWRSVRQPLERGRQRLRELPRRRLGARRGDGAAERRRRRRRHARPRRALPGQRPARPG